MIAPTDYLRLTLDPIRLAVLGRAAEGPVDIADLAQSLGVGHRKVLTAVGKLRDAGLLTDDLSLDLGVVRSVGAALPDLEPADPIEGTWTDEERTVLSRFFQGSRLASIPASHAKRGVVLERLAQEFEPGIRYQERQVNLTLQLFHEDYAALRRYMVDQGLLSRADGVYWRTGGRYEAWRSE